MNLVKKEIKFNNDVILTVMESEKIFVSIKHVCENLGMNKTQTDTQRKKIQNDGTLQGAGKFLPLKTNGGIQKVLMIELDYLPLWLAKINPSRFDDILKQKLLDYQLHCKDILANEFLGERKEILVKKNPALNDTENRIKKIRDLEDELIDIYTEIKYHYNFINTRSHSEIRKIDNNLKELKKKHFTLEGKKLTTDEIDELNKKNLEIEKNKNKK